MMDMQSHTTCTPQSAGLPQDNTLLAPITEEQIDYFQARLLEWFEREGRHDLPWKPQECYSLKINLYRIWISEIMLQQTQVATVIPYFERFMTAFPTPETLAIASEEAVLHHWQGLGYYSRARNLHSASQMLVSEYQGVIPADFEAVRRLKGIGDTTASAILAQGYNLPFAILDGNVRRVLARITGLQAPRAEQDRRLKPISEAFLCQQNPADYTQAIMDFGATLCKLKPECGRCFLKAICQAYQHQKTTTIPAKAIQKSRPTESVALLLFHNEKGEILLEKRPKNGIWGNLYSLPEIILQGRNEKSQSSALFQHNGKTYQLTDFPDRQAITTFQHQFTHYTLNATLFRSTLPADISHILATDTQDRYQWVDRAILAQKPKPQPITALFAQIDPLEDLFSPETNSFP